jgi:hypothetical protein
MGKRPGIGSLLAGFCRKNTFSHEVDRTANTTSQWAGGSEGLHGRTVEKELLNSHQYQRSPKMRVMRPEFRSI